MKSILEFNLPEEQEEFETANDGWKYKSVLFDLDNFLRNKLKYEELQPGEDAAYDRTRQELWNMINDYKLSLY